MENVTRNRALVRRGGRFVLTLLIAAAVATELAFLFKSIYTLSSSKDVLMARDDDSAVFLETTAKTTWINDIDAPYGPLYYRISATVHLLVPMRLFSDRDSPTPNETYESYHFAMMLTSALSLLFLCGLVAHRIASGWPERLAVFGVLMLVLSSYKVWSHHIFRGHPELLLTALVAAATLFSLKIPLRGSRLRDRSFYLAAVLWGLACTTKQSAGAFALGYCIVLLLPYSGDRSARYFDPRRLKEVAAAGGLMVFTYLAAGAPRTLTILSNMASASAFVSRKSQGFSIEWAFEWLKDFGAHLWLPVGVVFIAALLFTAANRKGDGNPKPPSPVLGTVWPTLLIPLIPLAMILKTQLVIPTEHYMLTLIGALLVWQTFFQAPHVTALCDIITPRLPGPIRSGVTVAAILCVTAVILRAKGTTEAASWEVNQQARCIPAVEEMIETILQERSSNRNLILATPYFPCPFEHRCRQVWGMTEQRVQKFRPRFIGISHRYAKRFLHKVSAYDRHNRPDWREVSRFHRQFHQHDSVDQQGVTWRLVLRTKTCGYELWKRLPKKKRQ